MASIYSSGVVVNRATTRPSVESGFELGSELKSDNGMTPA
jgi:hypothetical protein